MTYEIFTAESDDVLTRDVNQAISEGWEPLGGIDAMVYERVDARKGYTERITVLRQAMILRSEQP